MRVGTTLNGEISASLFQKCFRQTARCKNALDENSSKEIIVGIMFNVFNASQQIFYISR